MLLRLLTVSEDELERVNLLTHHAGKLTEVFFTFLKNILFCLGWAGGLLWGSGPQGPAAAGQ